MKILDNRSYSLGDKRFIHVATVREGLRDYMCFKESEEFFNHRKIYKPFPPKAQIYVEEIKPLNANSFSVAAIDDDELWRAIVGLLLIEGIIKKHDLLEGYHDCVAAINKWMLKDIYEKTSS